MRIKEGFTIKELGDKFIIIPKVSSNLDFTSMITLNKTGKVLFESLADEKTIDELIQVLISRYDVSYIEARGDVLTFIKKLQDNGLLDE